MLRRQLVLGLVILVLIGSTTWHRSLAQSREEYFDETGHVVSGEFLDFYRSVPNPIQLYGYPITNAFRDPTQNLWLQYFQKARFELDPTGVEGNRVKLSPLGGYLHIPGPRALQTSDPGACRAFAPKGYLVCHAFLDFYDKNGGKEQFGEPLSNAEVLNGRTVQYFTNARFEWHTELKQGPTVMLADLGRQYFENQAEDPSLLVARQSGDIINSIRTLKVRAYPTQAVTGKTGSQMIYVMVQDQRLLPVENAEVAILVQLPNRPEKRWVDLPPTNKAGITQYAFPFNAEEIGVATIQVVASRGDLESDTTTSFRIWW
jgi:hypothetical protein